VTKLEKCPSKFTQHFIFEYIDLITLSSLSVTELINSGWQSYKLRSLNLFLLMYADDTVLFSENVDDLQKMINSVNVCSNEYDLYINLLKTKIVKLHIHSSKYLIHVSKSDNNVSQLK
jgi:hypothetical protein